MDKTAVDTLIAAGSREPKPVQLDDKTITGVMVPEGYDFKVFRPPHELPPYISAQPTFTRLESFVEYVNRFKNGDSQVFAELNSANIRAYIDYHAPNEVKPNQHVVTLSLGYSDELKAWREIDNQPLNQLKFAEFIEENRLNVLEPDGAKLLEMVTNLSTSKKVEFQSSVRLSDGNARVSWTEEGSNKGNDLEIPSKLRLGLPIFHGEETVYAFEAFLRCHIRDGQASFKVKLERPQKLIDEAFKDVTDKLTKETSLVVLEGKLYTSRF